MAAVAAAPRSSALTRSCSRPASGQLGGQPVRAGRGLLRLGQLPGQGGSLGGQPGLGPAVGHRHARGDLAGQRLPLVSQPAPLGPGGVPAAGRGGHVGGGHQPVTGWGRSGMRGRAADRAGHPIGQLAGQLGRHPGQSRLHQPLVLIDQGLVRVHRGAQRGLPCGQPLFQASQAGRVGLPPDRRLLLAEAAQAGADQPGRGQLLVQRGDPLRQLLLRGLQRSDQLVGVRRRLPQPIPGGESAG